MALLGSTNPGNQSTADSYTGIHPVATVPIVRNSIVANATSGGGTAPDVFGAIASNGHNLFTQSSVAGAIFDDLLGTDPELAAVADNGGPTNTLAPLPAARRWMRAPTPTRSALQTSAARAFSGSAATTPTSARSSARC